MGEKTFGKRAEVSRKVRSTVEENSWERQMREGRAAEGVGCGGTLCTLRGTDCMPLGSQTRVC